MMTNPIITTLAPLEALQLLQGVAASYLNATAQAEVIQISGWHDFVSRSGEVMTTFCRLLSRRESSLNPDPVLVAKSLVSPHHGDTDAWSAAMEELVMAGVCAALYQAALAYTGMIKTYSLCIPIRRRIEQALISDDNPWPMIVSEKIKPPRNQ